jgi:hypothetical protein
VVLSHNPSISASQISGISGISHHTWSFQLLNFIFSFFLIITKYIALVRNISEISQNWIWIFI